ncbi:hypothetical protein BHE74_00011354 [Ensete ventricosum]|nr:hypothetical protein BHE74_00011354 [Ensete ventricosum]
MFPSCLSLPQSDRAASIIQVGFDRNRCFFVTARPTDDNGSRSYRANDASPPKGIDDHNTRSRVVPRHGLATERLDVYMEQSSTGRGGLLRRNRAHSSTPQTTETRIPRHGADHRTGTGHRNHEPLSDNPTVRLLNQLSLPDIMVRVFPEQAAPPTLASPAVGAEEVFVHEGEPARELLLLHAPQAPPLAQLPRTVPPPHRFLLRQRRLKRRGRLLRAGGRNRVIVAFFALLWSILLRSRRPRPSRRSRPGRRRLLPSRRLGGDLGGRWWSVNRGGREALSAWDASHSQLDDSTYLFLLHPVDGRESDPNRS